MRKGHPSVRTDRCQHLRREPWNFRDRVRGGRGTRVTQTLSVKAIASAQVQTILSSMRAA